MNSRICPRTQVFIPLVFVHGVCRVRVFVVFFTHALHAALANVSALCCDVVHVRRICTSKVSVSFLWALGFDMCRDCAAHRRPVMHSAGCAGASVPSCLSSTLLQDFYLYHNRPTRTQFSLGCCNICGERGPPPCSLLAFHFGGDVSPLYTSFFQIGTQALSS
jgi:hypothetical protein